MTDGPPRAYFEMLAMDPWSIRHSPRSLLTIEEFDDFITRYHTLAGGSGSPGTGRVAMKEPTEQLFLEWFAEQYECGLPNVEIVRECSAYLQGIRDERHGSDANIANLSQCLTVLKSAETMIRALKQYEVKIRD